MMLSDKFTAGPRQTYPEVTVEEHATYPTKAEFKHYFREWLSVKSKAQYMSFLNNVDDDDPMDCAIDILREHVAGLKGRGNLHAQANSKLLKIDKCLKIFEDEQRQRGIVMKRTKDGRKSRRLQIKAREKPNFQKAELVAKFSQDYAQRRDVYLEFYKKVSVVLGKKPTFACVKSVVLKKSLGREIRKQQPDAAFWLCCEKAKGAFLTLQQRNACMAYMDYKRLCDRYVVERKMLRVSSKEVKQFEQLMEKDNICLDGIGKKKSECYCEIRRRLANNDHDFNMLTEFETFLEKERMDRLLYIV